jgi:hypothetical protein
MPGDVILHLFDHVGDQDAVGHLLQVWLSGRSWGGAVPSVSMEVVSGHDADMVEHVLRLGEDVGRLHGHIADALSAHSAPGQTARKGAALDASLDAARTLSRDARQLEVMLEEPAVIVPVHAGVT